MAPIVTVYYAKRSTTSSVGTVTSTQQASALLGVSEIYEDSDLTKPIGNVIRNFTHFSLTNNANTETSVLLQHSFTLNGYTGSVFFQMHHNTPAIEQTQSAQGVSSGDFAFLTPMIIVEKVSSSVNQVTILWCPLSCI